MPQERSLVLENGLGMTASTWDIRSWGWRSVSGALSAQIDSQPRVTNAHPIFFERSSKSVGVHTGERTQSLTTGVVSSARAQMSSGEFTRDGEDSPFLSVDRSKC